jgi:hypothetical protein
VAEGDDLRLFIREIVARHERVWRDQLAELRALREEQDRQWRDNRAEQRAQREALFQILDKLQNGGASA